MKTFAIILRKTAKYYFRGQETAPQDRAKGVVIADASLENAAFYIAHRSADLYVGPGPRKVEWLNGHAKKSPFKPEEQLEAAA
jgi:hypothetical protein